MKNIKWVKMPTKKYEMINKYHDYLSGDVANIIFPLEEDEYLRIKKDMENKEVIELHQDDPYFNDDNKVIKKYIALLGSADMIFNEHTNADSLLQSTLSITDKMVWMESNYNYKTNEVGLNTDTKPHIAKMGQIADRTKTFLRQLGSIGNPDYFMVVNMRTEHINRLVRQEVKDKIKQQGKLK